MNTLLFGILIITSFLFTIPLIQDSHELSCAQPDLEQDVENSEIVFSGKVISVEGESKNENGFDIYTTFSIIENFKGVYWDSVLVRSHNIWGPGFAEGKEYLVFAGWQGNNVIASLCSSTGFLEKSDIELVRAVSQEYLLPPLQQIEKGAQPEKVKCKIDLELVFKINDSPACVKPESIPKLIERGWAKNENSDIQTSSTFDCAKTWDEMVTFSSNYTNSGLDNQQIRELDNFGKELGDVFFKNRCVSKIDQWWHDIEDPTGFNMRMNDPDIRQMWLEQEESWNYGLSLVD